MKSMRIFLTAAFLLYVSVSFGQGNSTYTICSHSCDDDWIVFEGGDATQFGNYEIANGASYKYTDIENLMDISEVVVLSVANGDIFIDSLNGLETVKINISKDSDSVYFTLKSNASPANLAKVTIHYTSSVSIDDKIRQDFMLYSHNKNIKVETTQTVPYLINIHDLNGSIIFKENNIGDFNKTLNIPNGIYFMNIITDSGILTKKLFLNE